MSEAGVAPVAETKVETQVKGIQCPACGTADDYAGKTKERQIDNSVKRKCQCKACGTLFYTIEVPLGIVEPKRSKK